VKPAVFVDRDGTLIEERGYLDRLSNLSLFPWTGDAVRLLNRAGFAVVVISNQSGVARGMFDEAFVDDTHREIDRRIAPARIDGYFYCPHLPDARDARYGRPCSCANPNPGRFARPPPEPGLALPPRFMVGDPWPDIELGRVAGARQPR
jgi:D-glycero-D-manno-heptose 1,7-bisphosphate phosphatase